MQLLSNRLELVSVRLHPLLKFLSLQRVPCHEQQLSDTGVGRMKKTKKNWKRKAPAGIHSAISLSMSVRGNSLPLYLSLYLISIQHLREPAVKYS